MIARGEGAGCSGCWPEGRVSRTLVEPRSRGGWLSLRGFLALPGQALVGQILAGEGEAPGGGVRKTTGSAQGADTGTPPRLSDRVLTFTEK